MRRRVLIGMAAAVVAIPALVIVQSRDDNASPEEVATGFVAAYGDLDADQASGYLAEDADLSELVSSVGARTEGTREDFRLLVSLLRAQGYRQTLDSCVQVSSTASGTTVGCGFAFHGLRSNAIGRGPFTGSNFDLTVRDGRIASAALQWNLAEFSPQMWEPFAGWVSKAHPSDAAVMYQDETYTGARLSEASIRLWDRRTPGVRPAQGRIDQVNRVKVAGGARPPGRSPRRTSNVGAAASRASISRAGPRPSRCHRVDSPTTSSPASRLASSIPSAPG